MDDDGDALSGADIHWLASCVADGTAKPKEARQLLAEFVRKARSARIEPRLIEHVRDCLDAFLANEKMLLPALDAGRFGLTPVPIHSLEQADTKPTI
jgi:hypothetical protein